MSCPFAAQTAHCSGGSKDGDDKGLPVATARLSHGQFPYKLHQLLQYAEQNLRFVACWHPDGEAFKIYDKKAFADHLLSKYFRTSVYKSFSRNLNIWGFHRDFDGSIRHPHFRRHRVDLCQNMARHGGKPKVLLGSDARAWSARALSPTKEPAKLGKASRSGARGASRAANACCLPPLSTGNLLRKKAKPTVVSNERRPDASLHNRAHFHEAHIPSAVVPLAALPASSNSLESEILQLLGITPPGDGQGPLRSEPALACFLQDRARGVPAMPPPPTEMSDLSVLAAVSQTLLPRSTTLPAVVPEALALGTMLDEFAKHLAAFQARQSLVQIAPDAALALLQVLAAPRSSQLNSFSSTSTVEDTNEASV